MIRTITTEVFNQIRDGIRAYAELPGHLFDTFAKDDFIEKKTATIYVPKRFARFGHDMLFSALLNDYPGLHSEYTVLHRHVFSDDVPGRPKRKGDAILVCGGACLLYTSPSPRD